MAAWLKPSHTTITITYGVGFDRHGKEIKKQRRDRIEHWIAEWACELFSGYTSIPISGAWVDSDGLNVREEARLLILHIIDADDTDDGHDPLDDVEWLVQRIGRWLNQDTVCVTRYGCTAFVQIEYPDR